MNIKELLDFKGRKLSKMVGNLLNISSHPKTLEKFVRLQNEISIEHDSKVVVITSVGEDKLAAAFAKALADAYVANSSSALIIDALGVRASQTTTDHLIVSTTSNWGGYALAAALEQLSGTRCLPEAEDTGRFLADLVDEGLINALGDGDNYGVDGFPAAVGIDIIQQLRHLIDSERKDS